METPVLTPAERLFRLWMLISAVMFGFAVPFFLLAGVHIVRVINAISAKIIPALPLYPLPPGGLEGAFWRVLSVSMMAMLTWACCMIYKDVRRNGRIVVIVLLSKFCSTACYSGLFLSGHYLAYLVGALTDGPIFLLTLVLWYLAAGGERFLDAKEEEILAALGDAFIPRGGAFELGFLDRREECLAGARQLLAAQDAGMVAAVRIVLRLLNLTPIFLTWRYRSLLTIPQNERSAYVERIEIHRFSLIRAMVLWMKTYILIPFFNLPEAGQAVGYDPEARAVQ